MSQHANKPGTSHLPTDAENHASLDSLKSMMKKNTQLTTNKPIDGTPFRVVGNEEVGYHVVIRNYLMSRPHKTPEEAEKAIHQRDWEIVASLIMALVDIMKDVEQEKVDPDKIIELANANLK